MNEFQGKVAIVTGGSMYSDKQRQRRARNGPTGDLITAAPARRGATSVVAVPRVLTGPGARRLLVTAGGFRKTT